MRDAAMTMGILFYGGEGTKPEPAKPKPAEPATPKPADEKDPGDKPAPKT